MALIPHDHLYDLLHDRRFKQQKPYHKIHANDKEYLKTLTIRMEDKALKRIADIKTRLQNDLTKNSFMRKYQIKSRYEYNSIKEFCKSLDMKGYELLWHNDMNGIKTNKLDKIIEGNYFCCRECDTPMTFINKMVPVMYCYLSKITT